MSINSVRGPNSLTNLEVVLLRKAASDLSFSSSSFAFKFGGMKGGVFQPSYSFLEFHIRPNTFVTGVGYCLRNIFNIEPIQLFPQPRPSISLCNLVPAHRNIPKNLLVAFIPSKSPNIRVHMKLYIIYLIRHNI